MGIMSSCLVARMLLSRDLLCLLVNWKGSWHALRRVSGATMEACGAIFTRMSMLRLFHQLIVRLSKLFLKMNLLWRMTSC